ncbi:hypothetical protein ACIBO5_58965 [Nonomuraea angiospora]|uniref:hypothetical protein n=1 Tax=Nonomuraea angiospora TaxID=46172 RepID=UPI0029BF2C6D|nr:hypothetical protein [Nonomuraea angiospora]MDX3100929.1 hypothetical protein [Nonomuraea angiospora]
MATHKQLTTTRHPSTTSPVNSDIDEARQAARIQIAGQMYDDAGPIAMIADEAWVRACWWIPADDAAHQVLRLQAVPMPDGATSGWTGSFQAGPK